MITFHPCVVPGSKRKDGTWAVVIRVTFRGKARRLPTNIVCTADDLTRSERIKSQTVLKKADVLVRRMREAVEHLDPFQLEGWDVDRVVREIRDRTTADTFRLDFFEFADDYLKGKSGSTRKAYTTAVNALALFLGRRELDINAITRDLMYRLRDHIDGGRRTYYDPRTGEFRETDKVRTSPASSTRTIAYLAHIFAAARNRYNDEDSGRILIPRSPFTGIPRVKPSPEGQRNLGAQLVQQIIDEALEDNGTALCVFVVSFGLMGANMADLYRAAPPTDGVWSYRRQKTEARRADHAEMRVRVPEVLRPFLQRLGAGRSSKWWLPVIHGQRSKDHATCNANSHLKAWAEAHGVAPFTFYAARHSWASIARAAGVEKATLDECLCHKGDFAVTDIYAERAWHLMDQANATVLALFRWPTTEGSAHPSAGNR